MSDEKSPYEPGKLRPPKPILNKPAWPPVDSDEHWAGQGKPTADENAYARGLADGIHEAIEVVELDLKAVKSNRGRAAYEEIAAEWNCAVNVLSQLLTKLRRIATGAASASKGEK